MFLRRGSIQGMKPMRVMGNPSLDRPSFHGSRHLISQSTIDCQPLKHRFLQLLVSLDGEIVTHFIQGKHVFPEHDRTPGTFPAIHGFTTGNFL